MIYLDIAPQSNNPSESSKFTYSSNLDTSSNPGRSSIAQETSSSNVACYNNPNSIGYSSILTSNFGQSSLASNPRTFEEFRRSSVSVGYVSVSDLCGADEIEFLLDDIRDLVEPAKCKPEDFQDFEIAGSRTDAVSVELSLLESPLGAPISVHSWDSHAHYRQCAPPRILSPLHGVPIYCDKRKFKSPAVIFKILLFITSLSCLVTLCSSGTVQVGLFLLPLLGRIRLMMFITLFSMLVTGFILFLDITHIIILFPFNWNKINTWLYLSIGILFIIGSSFLVHTVFFATDFAWVPKHSKHHIFATAMVGYLCSLEAF
ncbi:uncharacterized protein LOC113367059 [Ctenocephalides felis]|uniref:uncharacterized protein LOC113367059 n=1 Tax=Ctenocephalides felis TaxID=7515 RepID=UPI000E6E27A1|nr:uncharacterized protein LOC113367059 [Ctenocephalides felis]